MALDYQRDENVMPLNNRSGYAHTGTYVLEIVTSEIPITYHSSACCFLYLTLVLSGDMMRYSIYHLYWLADACM